MVPVVEVLKEGNVPDVPVAEGPPNNLELLGKVGPVGG